MPGAMDERVVSMEFDNKQFEKNVKTSMKTIDDLKESLDFSKSGETLDEIDSKFKKIGKSNMFDTLNSSSMKLQKSMLLLGDSTSSLMKKFMEATKITAIFQAAEAAVHSLERSIKQFTIAPINEGFDKYKTKIGAIKTIANATKLGAEEVNDELERLNWFTDETSASFGNMVENIGKFTSVGRGLSESITAMQGIATWGYQSGAGVTEINRAMYNLSQALGTGAVKLMDWKSIENAGMATEEFKKQAIAAAEAAGKLKRKGDKLFAGNQEVTTANFNATLQKGWFTSDVLMSVLEEYGGFATELREYMENDPSIERATDAMEKMDKERLDKRAQLFRENYELFGEKTGKTIEQVQSEIDKIAEIEDIEEKEKAIEDFAHTFGVEMSEVRRINDITNTKDKEKEIAAWANKLSISAAEARKMLEALAETEESLGEKAFKSSQQSKSLEDAINATKDAVSTGWMNTFQTIFGGLDDSVKLWTDVTDILWDLFAAGADWRNNAFTHWAEEFAGRDDLWGDDGILHSIMDTIIELKNLLGSSFKNVFFSELEKVLGGNYTEGEGSGLKSGELTVEQIRYRREGNFFGGKLKEITTNLKNFGLTIRNFVNNNLDKFKRIFESVASVVKFFGSIVSSVFSTIGNFLHDSGIVQDILDLAARIGDKIREITEKIQESKIINKILTNIGNTLTWFYTTIKNWVNQIGEFLEETGIAQAIRDFFGRIEAFFLGGAEDVDENGKKTESAFFRAFGWLDTVKEWIDGINLKDVLYTVKSFFDHFGTLWSAFTGGLSGGEVNTDQMVDEGLPAELKGVADSFAGIGQKLSGVISFFTGIWEKFTGWLETSGILPTLRGWWDGISTFFGNIGLVWEAFTTGKVADPKKLNDKQKKLVNGVINFAKKLQNAWGKVKGWFVSAWEWVKELWGKFTGWLESSGILPWIRQAWQSIKEFFENLGMLWNVFIKGEKVDPDKMTESQLGIIEKVKAFFDKIRGAWDSAVGWLESSGILPTLRSWWEAISGFFEEIWNSIGDGSVFQKVGDFFADLWNKILGIFGGGQQAEGVTEAIGNMVPSGEGVGEKTGGFFQSIADAFTNNGKFDLVKGLSTGIAKLFETIGNIDWLSISTSIFGVIADIINGLDDACGKIHIDNIIKLIKKIIGAFTGIMIVKSISDITSTIRTIVKKGKDKGLLEKFTDLLASIGTAILQIGIAIALIAASMWLISKIDEKRFGTALGVMIGIGAFLVGFMLIAYVLTRTMGKDANKLAKTFGAIGSMFLQIAIAVAIVVASVWLVTLMLGENGEISDKLRNAMFIVAGIMIVMSAIVVAIGQFLKNTGTINVQMGIAMFLGIAILLGVCVAAILLLQNVDPGKAFIVIGELTVLLGVIAAMLIVMSKTIKKFNPKILAPMIVIVVALIAIVAALVLLKDADQGTLAIIGGVLAGVLLTIARVILLLQHVNPAGAVQAALAIGLFITAIMGALAIGSFMLSAAVKNLMNALVDVMSSMGAASNSASLINKEAILGAIALLDDIVAAFAKTTSCDTTVALQVASDTWTFLNRFSLASQSAEEIAVDKFEAIFGKDGTGGLLSSIHTALASVTETGQNALTLSSNLKTFGENLQAFGESAKTFANKDTGYKAGIVELFGSNGKGGLFNAIKTGISNIKDTGWNARVLLWNLSDMGNHLELLSKSGSNLGGDAATNIGNVKDRLQDLTTIVDLAKQLTIVGEDGDVYFDPTTLAIGIANIGAALELYNTAIAAYKEQVKTKQGVDLDSGEEVPKISTDNIKTALDSIVSALPTIKPGDETMDVIEGWATMDTGDDGTTLFALGLVNMANALSDFSEKAKSFDSAKSQMAILALSQLAAIYEATGNGEPSMYDSTISGVAGWNDQMGGTGDNNKFASAIIGMGNALSSFSTSAEGFNYFKSFMAISALEMLASIYKTTGMDDPGQYNDMIAGVKTWDPGEGKGSFTSAIIGMGNAMASFGDKVKDIPNDSVSKATTALQTLAAIYKELSSDEGKATITYFSSIDDDSTISMIKEIGKSSIEETFTDFGEGIGKLGDALKKFGKEINPDSGYDSEKVTAAVGILQDLGKLQTTLQTTDVKGDLFTKALFGENDIKKLGENLSGLGSRLKTFSDEVKNFDIDVTEGGGELSKWQNIKAILDYFTAIWVQLSEVPDVIDETIEKSTDDSYEKMEKHTTLTSYIANILLEFGEGIEQIVSALDQFDDLMYKTYQGDENKKFGEWSESAINHVKTVLDTCANIAVLFSKNEILNNNFYNLKTFGKDMNEMFRALNADNVLSGFMNKFNGGSNNKSKNRVSNFLEFMEGLNTMANAVVSFHGMGVNATDVANLGSLMNAVMSLNYPDLSTANFNADGLKLATDFINGFAQGLILTNDDTGASQAWKLLSEAMGNLISFMSEYSSEFYDSGYTAGEQYAAGFNAGLGDISADGLSPVINMDTNGKVTGGTGIVSVLAAMNYATATDINGLATRLDSIQRNFENPISVKDTHDDIITAINATSTKLKDINEEVSSLSTKVENLKVFIEPHRLVGAIASEMDRQLGMMANVSP